jgi:hypothetical protein
MAPPSAREVGVKWCQLCMDLCGAIVDRIDQMDVMNFWATCESWRDRFLELDTQILKSGMQLYNIFYFEAVICTYCGQSMFL